MAQKQTTLLQKPTLSDDFKLFTLKIGAKGQAVTIQYKESDTKQIKLRLFLDSLEEELRQRFVNNLSRLAEIIAKSFKLFSSVKDELTIQEINADTIGKGMEKRTVFMFKYVDRNGPKKNLLCSGGLSVDQLSATCIEALNALSQCFQEIIEDDRFIVEDGSSDDDEDDEGGE